jgi:hypothetical protein
MTSLKLERKYRLSPTRIYKRKLPGTVKVFQGYRSIAGLAKDAGLPYETVRSRINRGFDPELVDKPHKDIIAAGRFETRLKDDSLLAALDRIEGLTHERKGAWHVNGSYWLSPKQIADAFGIPLPTVNARIRAGCRGATLIRPTGNTGQYKGRPSSKREQERARAEEAEARLAHERELADAEADAYAEAHPEEAQVTESNPEPLFEDFDVSLDFGTETK